MIEQMNQTEAADGQSSLTAVLGVETENEVKTFETYERIEGMLGCMKKPIEVHAMQMQEEFRVDTLEGNYKQGKPGDYLMRGIAGELYICDREIFQKSYEWL